MTEKINHDRRYLLGATVMNTGSKGTALITGASSGIGAIYGKETGRAYLPFPRHACRVSGNSTSLPCRWSAAVLVDFWEYTCVNWIRTLPYVNAWNRDYADRGVVVIGVHAPEFEFGKRPENIDRGIRDHGLPYPIALDNDFATWQAFGNNAWPTKYLFDAHGTLVKRWVGEGSYNDIEAEIRRLLVAASTGTKLPPISPEATAFAKAGEPSYAGITAETYVGAERREPGTVRLEGNWRTSRQYLELQNGTGRIVLPFTAGEVNLVMHPAPTSVLTESRASIDRE